MRYGLTVTSAPATEPVSLTEAKLHLHYDADDQDDRINTLIAAARGACERETNRAFITQTLKLSLDCIAPRDIVDLPRAPLQSITSVTYYDTAGTLQTLDAANYQYDSLSEPGRLAPARNLFWPTVDTETLAPFQVTYVAGWTGATLVPDEIKQAMLLLIGHWFENLQEVITGTIATQLPFATKALLNHWKVPYTA